MIAFKIDHSKTSHDIRLIVEIIQTFYIFVRNIIFWPIECFPNFILLSYKITFLKILKTWDDSEIGLWFENFCLHASLDKGKILAVLYRLMK